MKLTATSGTYTPIIAGSNTLVHPYNRRAPGIPVNRQLQVTYDTTGNGYFDNDPSITTNVVTYDATCESEDKEYEVVKRVLTPLMTMVSMPESIRLTKMMKNSLTNNIMIAPGL